MTMLWQAMLRSGIKHYPGLLQYPGLNLFMVHTQQLQGPHGVMLFSRGAWLVALNLRHHAHGHFKPLSQALE